MPDPAQGRSQEADVADFEQFFRREHPRLLTVAVAMTGDREVARELVQEALLRAYRAWPAVSTLERPGAWARRVLVNLSTDVRRRRGREQVALARSLGEATLDLPDPASAAFLAAVRSLPRLQRAAVALYYFDDLPLAEVADVLDVSPGSVKTSLSRARAALAPAMATEWQGGTER